MHTQVAYLECSYQFINLQVTMAIHIGRKMEYIDNVRLDKISNIQRVSQTLQAINFE